MAMSPELLAALQAGASAPTAAPLTTWKDGRYVLNQPNQPAPQKQRGKGGFLSSIISELGGAGGALGGAAGGAALGSVVPGIGNIVGGIAGGIVGGIGGGFGGRLAENKWRDNEYRIGDALKEGAVSGAFGGLGPAWQGARGLNALGKAAGGKGLAAGIQALSGFGDDATRAVAGKAISRGGKKAAQSLLYGGNKLNVIQTAGRGMAGNASGVGIGSQAKGIENLGAQSQDEILAALKKVGLNRSNPEKTIRGLEPVLKTKGASIAKAYENSTRKFTAKELDDLGVDILGTIANDPSIELSSKATDELFRKITLLTGNRRPLDVWEFQKKIGNAINFGKGVEAKLVDREAVARVIRSKTGVLLDDAVKEVAENRGLYHTLKDADKLMRVASKTADKSGLVARIGTSAPFRASESKLGGALEAVGNVAANRVVSQGARVSRGMATRGIANQTMQPTQDPAQQNTTIYGSEAQQGFNEQGYGTDQLQGYGQQQGYGQPQGYGQNPTQQTQQSSYSLQQAMSDLRNPANAGAKAQSQIMDRYNFVSKAEAAQQKFSNPKLSSEQQKRLLNSDVMTSTLDALEQAIAGFNQPSNQAQATVKGLYSGTIGRLVNEDTKVYLDQIRLDAIRAIRSAGEVGNLSGSEQAAALRSVPGLGDTAQGAQRKINRLRTLLVDAQQKAVYNLGQQGNQYQETPQYQQQGGYQ